MSDPSSRRLPPLRNDVVLLQGPDGDEGPSWLIYDPLRHKYFSVDRASFDILRLWSEETVESLIKAIGDQTTHRPNIADVDRVRTFLMAHDLIDRGGATTALTYADYVRKTRIGFGKFILRQYLFFRVPLIKPQKILEAIYPVAKYIFGMPSLILFIAILICGLVLVGQQWDRFVSTYTAFGTWQGQAGLLVAIIFSKCVHEFGHALALYRYGGRVATMGVAFLLMFPMLYTDTTDSWRVRSRAERVVVGSAGIISELMLASIALLLWSFVDEVTLKSGLFILASTVWIGTLLINASPFMKFDGYYILSDYLGMANLHDRSFAIGRWKLRRILFGIVEAPPEQFPKRQETFLAYFAFATWLYRFMLFLGIAVLVYNFFFKALGLLLMAVEIWVFIGRPIVGELRQWWRHRNSVRLNANTAVTAVVVLVVIAATFIPWRDTIAVPAMVEASESYAVYAPASAQIQTFDIADGDSVEPGDAIGVLTRPGLELEIAQTISEMESLSLQIDMAQIDRGASRDVDVLRRQVAALASQLRALKKEQALLQLHTPIGGLVMDLPNRTLVGSWVEKGEFLGRVVSSSGARIVVFVNESDVDALDLDSAITFISDVTGAPAIEAFLAAETLTSATAIEDPAIASVFGGRLDVVVENDGSLRPISGVYRLSGTVDDLAVSQMLTGVARLSTEGTSLFERVVRHVAMVLLEQSGF